MSMAGDDDTIVQPVTKPVALAIGFLCASDCTFYYTT